MLPAITILLVYQTVGEIAALWLGLPIPGPVIGMVMLFATLVARGSVPDNLRDTANGLLTHLSLLFVPAGVGLMIHIERIRGEALPIVVSLVVSTAATIAVTALVFAWFRRVRP
jgi:holin-like protein